MHLTPAIGHPGGDWLAEAAGVALGAAAAAAVGLAALRPAASWPRETGPRRAVRLRFPISPARASLAGTAGLALLTPLLYLLWGIGLSPSPAVVLIAAAVLGGGLALGPALLARRRRTRRAAAPDRLGSSLRGPVWLPWLPAAAALGAFLWKLTRVPVWSWDHYAIWGVKARRLFPGGVLDPAWAMPDGVARPDYPLGLPLAWRVLTLGAEPGPAAFLAAHALMAVALVALTGWAAGRFSGSPLAGGAAAALVAASPLLWDTESLGLADLPLALWAVAAVAVIAARTGATTPTAGASPDELPAASDAHGSAAHGDDPAAGARETHSPPAGAPPLWVAGLCVGFLPWLKSEGLPLALGLLAASALIAWSAGTAGPGVRAVTRLRGVAALAVPALILGGAALAANPGVGDREVGFFRGDWPGRGMAALSEAPRLARTLAGDLAGSDWLGIWWLFAAGTIAAAALLPRARSGRGTREARGAIATAALASVVVAQLALYLATYLISYIPAEQHVATSFHRIAAALAPLALLAAAAALGAAGGGSSVPRRPTTRASQPSTVPERVRVAPGSCGPRGSGVGGSLRGL